MLPIQESKNSVFDLLKPKFNINFRKMGLTSAMYILISCMIVSAADGKSPIPLGWEGMCTARTDPDVLGFYVDNVTSVNHVINMQCHVKGDTGNTWQFQTLRGWFLEMRNISVFLQVRCSNMGKVSLPWPMKANGLIGLVVSNCILTDKYADFDNAEISQIPDQLRVLEIRNSVWLSDGSGFSKITSPEGLASLTSDYDCGQDSTIEYLVTSNVSDMLIPSAEEITRSTSEMKTLDLKNIVSDAQSDLSDLKSESHHNYAENVDFGTTMSDVLPLPDFVEPDLLNSNITFDSNATKNAQNDFMNLLKNLQSLDLKCNYEKLKLIDESFTHILPVHHFELMVQGAKYPELRIMNYSRSGIRKLPKELQDFRDYFPKLEYLDLSMNYLTEIRLPLRPRKVDSGYLTLDVRNNLISNISLQDIVAWSMAEDVIVDVRDNPVHCGCQMEQLLQEIQSDTFFVGNLQKYTYIRDLECTSPPRFRGQKLSKLNLKCFTGNYLSVPTPIPHVTVTSETIGIAIGCSVTVAVIVVAALFAIVVVYYRHGTDMFKKWPIDDASKAAPDKEVEAGLDNFKTKA